MDTSRTNGSLLEEINFLTNLIQSHREQQSGPSHQVKGRAVGPTSHSKSRYTPYQVPTTHHPHPHHPHPPSRVKARGRRSKANNLVYRPKNVSKTLLTSSPVSDPPSSSPGCLKATKTLGGPSLVVKREIIPKSVGRPAVLKSGDQTSISRTVVCVKTEPGLRIKTEPGSELSASKTPPHGSSSSNGGRSILVASDPRGKERVIITATRGASTSAQQTTTPEATALVAAVGGAGVGKGGSDEAEEAAMKLYKRQKRLRRKANAKARRELKHSTPSGHPPPPHFPLPPPPHFPLPPPPHTHTPPPPHSHIPPPPHSHISPPPHQPSAPPPHHPPLPRQPPAPPPHPPSYPHQPPAPPPHLPHRAPPPHSHPPPPPYPFHAPPPSFHLHFSKLRSKFKPSPQERRRKWVRKLAVTPTGATPKSGLLTSGVATNGMAGTVTKKRKSRPRKVRSRKGKDGLFKNKVWVPPDSSQNQPPQPHQPKPPRTPPTKTTKPSKNKVWIPPQNETEVIFISPKPGSRAKPALQEKPLALLGREITTKQGNKQWVLDGAKKPSSSLGLATPGVRKDMERSAKPVRLFGHEKKTKQGNKQWVVAGLVPKRTTRRRSRIKSSLVSFSGGRYSLDATGKRLKRLSTSSSSQLAALSPAISSYIGGVARNSSRRLMASRVVKKSKAYVWHARMKKKQDRSKQFCLFYNRFGKCNKGAECPYIHDPDKIAVCTRFLKGACDKMDGTCPFSHKISKEKMPVCSFFLRGVCSKEDCPYLHVSVGRDAEVCPDFLKGYCTRGEKCTMQHTLDCPKFSRTGSCPEGSKCPLRHNNKRNNKELQVPAAGLVKEPRAFKKVRCRQEVVSGGRVPEGKGQGDTGEGSEEGSSEPKQPARGVSPITINELEFMPLEINTGMRCSIGSSGHCLCASCDVCSGAVSGLEFSILISLGIPLPLSPESAP